MSRVPSLTHHFDFGGPTSSVVQFVAEPAPYIALYRAVPASQISGQPLNAEIMLEEIRKLKQDWDGYGALPITAEGCSHARTFIALTPKGMLMPEISPTSNGTISLEWESGNGDAYVEIGRTRYSGHIQTRHGSTFYLEGQLTNSAEQSLATEQVLAVINELLYGSTGAKSSTHSIQVPEPAL